jgi:hypothetical protein
MVIVKDGGHYELTERPDGWADVCELTKHEVQQSESEDGDVGFLPPDRGRKRFAKIWKRQLVDFHERNHVSLFERVELSNPLSDNAIYAVDYMRGGRKHRCYGRIIANEKSSHVLLIRPHYPKSNYSAFCLKSMPTCHALRDSHRICRTQVIALWFERCHFFDLEFARQTFSRSGFKL